MSYSPPIRANWPDFDPEGIITAGQPVTDETVEQLVKAQQWAAAYMGRQHCSDFWPITGDGVCQGQGSGDPVLDYDVAPRSGMRALEFRCRTWATVAASDCHVKIECVETGESVTEDLTAGTAYQYGTETLQIDRPDQWTQIRVYAWSDSGDVYLNSFAMWDQDRSEDWHSDYYIHTTEAGTDSLARYWAMQEDDDAGASATVIDTMGSTNLTGAGTISSELINGRRKYHRIPGATGYLRNSGGWPSPAASDWTVMIEVDDENTSGQRTYLSLGEAGTGGLTAFGFYGAGSAPNTGMLLEVGSTRAFDGEALPPSGCTTYFVVHDVSVPSVTVYVADGAGDVSTLVSAAVSPTASGTGVWIGNGRGTAGYLDAGDYLGADGTIRQCATWGRALSLMEMNSIARCLRVRGALLVR